MNPSSQQKQLKGGKNSILRQSHYIVLVGQNLLCRPGCPRTCSGSAESVPQVLDYRHALSDLTKEKFLFFMISESFSQVCGGSMAEVLCSNSESMWQRLFTSFRQASGMQEPDNCPCPSSSDPLLPWRPCLWNFPQHLRAASPDGEQGFTTRACWKTFQPQCIIKKFLAPCVPHHDVMFNKRSKTRTNPPETKNVLNYESK